MRVHSPPRRHCGPVRRVSVDRAGERLAGTIVEDILRRAEASKLDTDRVMLDVLVGLVAEMAAHRPSELANLVEDVAEAARVG